MRRINSIEVCAVPESISNPLVFTVNGDGKLSGPSSHKVQVYRYANEKTKKEIELVGIFKQDATSARTSAELILGTNS